MHVVRGVLALRFAYGGFHELSIVMNSLDVISTWNPLVAQIIGMFGGRGTALLGFGSFKLNVIVLMMLFTLIACNNMFAMGYFLCNTTSGDEIRRSFLTLQHEVHVMVVQYFRC